MEPNRRKDEEEDRRSRPGIPPPGKQIDHQQQPNAPPQPESTQPSRSSLWIPPSTGNPDLDPAALNQGQRIDLRERDPLIPRGMIYDPRQLLDHQRRPQSGGYSPEVGYLPPGARFDPFGPPDPSQVGPGRPPLPSSQFGVPDPDHLPPPGMPQQQQQQGGKSLKSPWPPRASGGGFPPPGGAGGSPFL